MDKNTVTGFALMGLILIGFTWYNTKQSQKFREEQRINDSIALVNERFNQQINTPLPVETPEERINQAQAVDSARRYQYGDMLYEATRGEESYTTLENELIKVTVSNKGGKIVGAQLKEYGNYKEGRVELYEKNSAAFNLSFFMERDYRSMLVNTDDYFFTPGPVVNTPDGGHALSMRLYADSISYMEFLYTLDKTAYMVGFDVRFENMHNYIKQDQPIDITWRAIGPQHEKGFENENNYSTIAYRYPGDKSINDIGLRSTSTKTESVTTRLNWVAFKQQFFSSVFIAHDNFENAKLGYDTYSDGDGRIKKYDASLSFQYYRATDEYNFSFYFGPNKYSILKEYDIALQRLVPLGWGIIGWVNRFVVIPVFDFLGNRIVSFGWIIFLLTIFIKLIILPLTYKSYLSMAKMRLLKPEIEELNEKYPKQEDAMKKQQATMELYKKAGVNPFGGCLPLLIQFPILFAMFRFFPASIELRGESLWWADDLSSYDSILQLPFNIPFYGDHVSLFTLLMAVSVFVTSKLNMAQQPTAGGGQMAGMKFMMLYIMPVMLMLWFNNYASGLSFYYLISNLITMGQTYGMRYVVNDDKLHARMKENAKKPKKQSKWQAKYQEMLKAQQQQQAAQQKKKK